MKDSPLRECDHCGIVNRQSDLKGFWDSRLLCESCHKSLKKKHSEEESYDYCGTFGHSVYMRGKMDHGR